MIIFCFVVFCTISFYFASLIIKSSILLWTALNVTSHLSCMYGAVSCSQPIHVLWSPEASWLAAMWCSTHWKPYPWFLNTNMCSVSESKCDGIKWYNRTLVPNAHCVTQPKNLLVCVGTPHPFDHWHYILAYADVVIVIVLHSSWSEVFRKLWREKFWRGDFYTNIHVTLFELHSVPRLQAMLI